VKVRARTTFDRQNFQLHWNQDLDQSGVVLGDKVDVTIALEASWRPSAPAPSAIGGGRHAASSQRELGDAHGGR
jgi:hypothetical protein